MKILGSRGITIKYLIYCISNPIFFIIIICEIKGME
jgi:hypothetical protein